MRSRRLIPGVLLLLLLSGWGTAFGAAFCPNMMPGHLCCHARRGHNAMQAMEGMGQMGEMQMESRAPDTVYAEAFNTPAESCPHCMVQSQLSPPAACLREAAKTRSGIEAAPRPATTPVLPLTCALFPVPSRPPAPPGATFNLRLLISIFRI